MKWTSALPQEHTDNNDGGKQDCNAWNGGALSVEFLVWKTIQK